MVRTRSCWNVTAHHSLLIAVNKREIPSLKQNDHRSTAWTSFQNKFCLFQEDLPARKTGRKQQNGDPNAEKNMQVPFSVTLSCGLLNTSLLTPLLTKEQCVWRIQVQSRIPASNAWYNQLLLDPVRQNKLDSVINIWNVRAVTTTSCPYRNPTGSWWERLSYQHDISDTWTKHPSLNPTSTDQISLHHPSSYYPHWPNDPIISGQCNGRLGVIGSRGTLSQQVTPVWSFNEDPQRLVTTVRFQVQPIKISCPVVEQTWRSFVTNVLRLSLWEDHLF